jgi:hypothetical protein
MKSLPNHRRLNRTEERSGLQPPTNQTRHSPPQYAPQAANRNKYRKLATITEWRNSSFITKKRLAKVPEYSFC